MMSRRIVAACLLSLSLVGCMREFAPSAERFRRLIPDPVLVPTSEEWRRVPNIRVRNNNVEVLTTSTPSGRKVATAAELRRLLLSLPPRDWPYGRQVLCLPPSIIGADEDEKLVQANLRWVGDVLRELEIAATMVR